LEQIYDDVVIPPDLQDLIASIFAPGTTAEIQARLNEVSGAQHAQLQQAILRTTQDLNSLVQERLDGVLISEDGVRYAGASNLRYAQAAGPATDAGPPAGDCCSHGLVRGPSGLSFWLRGFGSTANVDGDAEAPGYDQDSFGAVGGVDYAISP